MKALNTCLPITTLKILGFWTHKKMWTTYKVFQICQLQDRKRVKERTGLTMIKSTSKFIVTIATICWILKTVRVSFMTIIANQIYMKLTQQSMTFTFKLRASSLLVQTILATVEMLSLLLGMKVIWAKGRVRRTKYIHSMGLSCIYFEKDRARVHRWNQEK